MFEEQVRWAVEEGVDFFIAETYDCLGEASAALKAIRASGLPAMVTFIALEEKSTDGYPWEEACRILEQEGAQIVGLNCARGPATMLGILERIRRAVRCRVAAQPVPYRTMAEALGRKVPASRYSPDLSLHPVLGSGGGQCRDEARAP
jgi:betaine-homocysteine S-methyltransferase